jgi:hypothetical protein
MSWLTFIRKLQVNYLYIFFLCNNILVGILPVIVKSKQIKQLIVPSLLAHTLGLFERIFMFLRCDNDLSPMSRII